MLVILGRNPLALNKTQMSRYQRYNLEFIIKFELIVGVLHFG